MLYVDVTSHRKGVSAFIAVLLLLALTVAGGIVIYSYTMGELGKTQGDRDILSGQVSLESQTMSATEYTAYIRNLGKGTITYLIILLLERLFSPNYTTPLPKHASCSLLSGCVQKYVIFQPTYQDII